MTRYLRYGVTCHEPFLAPIILSIHPPLLSSLSLSPPHRLGIGTMDDDTDASNSPNSSPPDFSFRPSSGTQDSVAQNPPNLFLSGSQWTEKHLEAFNLVTSYSSTTRFVKSVNDHHEPATLGCCCDLGSGAGGRAAAAATRFDQAARKALLDGFPALCEATSIHRISRLESGIGPLLAAILGVRRIYRKEGGNNHHDDHNPPSSVAAPQTPLPQAPATPCPPPQTPATPCLPPQASATPCPPPPRRSSRVSKPAPRGADMVDPLAILSSSPAGPGQGSQQLPPSSPDCMPSPASDDSDDLALRCHNIPEIRSETLLHELVRYVLHQVRRPSLDGGDVDSDDKGTEIQVGHKEYDLNPEHTSRKFPAGPLKDPTEFLTA
ncbi:uncharacterized protein E0L32_003774 [Thyridium curvatum]|uniref:Uncharacterized protein n=1 Tax=Thyridium curvatum TaxID=1093900 RepID=A0A507BIR2_9PEZI|nr:uncharacterized protein E0L32_003774 [Thyridium curvatum]TPX16480.1 hypothetical protein E0L32_003774 [Thyridium curvatum]